MVDLAGGLEDLAALDDHTQACAAARADHDRRGRGEAEGARAGDDEHGDRRREGVAGGLPGEEPAGEGRPGDGEGRGDEHGGDPVGEPLHRGGGRLGLVDEAHDLGQHRVGAYPGGLDDQRSVAVDGRPDHIVAGSDRDRNGLAGDHRGIDARYAVDHHAVDGDLLARSHDEAHTDLKFFGRDCGAVLE